MGRSDVEQALLEDEAMLEQVARLIEAGAGICAGAGSMTLTSDFCPAAASMTWPNNLAGRSR